MTPRESRDSRNNENPERITLKRYMAAVEFIYAFTCIDAINSAQARILMGNTRSPANNDTWKQEAEAFLKRRLPQDDSHLVYNRMIEIKSQGRAFLLEDLILLLKTIFDLGVREDQHKSSTLRVCNMNLLHRTRTMNEVIRLYGFLRGFFNTPDFSFKDFSRQVAPFFATIRLEIAREESGEDVRLQVASLRTGVLGQAVGTKDP